MEYLKIENSDGKVWLLPNERLRTGLCLYQPSSIKGIMLKRTLPVFSKFIWLGRPFFARVGISRTSDFISREIYGYLNTMFYEHKEVLFAVFLGTPSVHQKVTIQIYCGNNILGYCKITKNKDIFSIFQHENKVLDYLKNKGINNIPSCMACEQICDGLYSFVQTTKKTIKSIVTHRLSCKELEFVEILKNRTSTQRSYDTTDYCKSISYLKTHLTKMEKNGYEIEMLEKSICVIERYCIGAIHEYSFCHRDFTPWNMFYDDGELFVFDFEYARYQYPPYLDLIHYFLQTSIFEKKLGVREIYSNYATACQNGILKGCFENYKLSLLMYLLDIISLYLERENDYFCGDVKHNMDIWVSLCETIQNDI